MGLTGGAGGGSVDDQGLGVHGFFFFFCFEEIIGRLLFVSGDSGYAGSMRDVGDRAC